MTEQDLAKCDIVLWIDKSGSMESPNREGNDKGPTRWETAGKTPIK